MDKNDTLKEHLRKSALENISKLGKGFKDKSDEDKAGSLLDKTREATVKSLKSTNDKVRKGVKEISHSISKPNRTKRFGRWIRNGAYNATSHALDIGKAGVHEGRSNIIASKIVGNRILGKKTTKAERKFLGKQAINNVKTVATVGAAGAAGLTVPLPGSTEAGAFVASKLGLAPKKQRIPSRYKDHNKMTKFNNWVERKKASLKKLKKDYNKEYDKKNPNDKNYSLDYQDKRDIRKENIKNWRNVRNGASNVALMAGSGVLGGLAGKSLSNSLYKKKQSRLQYLKDKGVNISESEKDEIKKLEKFLSSLKKKFVIGGAALGAGSFMVGNKMLENKLDSKKWKTS